MVDEFLFPCSVLYMTPIFPEIVCQNSNDFRHRVRGYSELNRADITLLTI